MTTCALPNLGIASPRDSTIISSRHAGENCIGVSKGGRVWASSITYFIVEMVVKFVPGSLCTTGTNLPVREVLAIQRYASTSGTLQVYSQT